MDRGAGQAPESIRKATRMSMPKKPKGDESLPEARKQAMEELSKPSETQQRILLTLADIIIDAYLEDRVASDAGTDAQ
jgi:hypothetical protein